VKLGFDDNTHDLYVKGTTPRAYIDEFAYKPAPTQATTPAAGAPQAEAQAETGTGEASSHDVSTIGLDDALRLLALLTAPTATPKADQGSVVVNVGDITLNVNVDVAA
jgi:hypothetical protein